MMEGGPIDAMANVEEARPSQGLLSYLGTGRACARSPLPLRPGSASAPYPPDDGLFRRAQAVGLLLSERRPMGGDRKPGGIRV